MVSLRTDARRAHSLLSNNYDADEDAQEEHFEELLDMWDLGACGVRVWAVDVAAQPQAHETRTLI